MNWMLDAVGLHPMPSDFTSCRRTPPQIHVVQVKSRENKNAPVVQHNKNAPAAQHKVKCIQHII